jgi:hypothetical protein
VKTDATELSRVAEDKRPLRLLQDKVIVFAGAKIGRFHAELAAHAEMNSQPAASVFTSPGFVRIVPRENKKHLFPARLGFAQFLTGEMTLERESVHSSEDPLLSMQPNGANSVSDPDVPFLAKIFYLGQLWHAGRLERSRPPCYPWREWKKLSLSGVVARA